MNKPIGYYTNFTAGDDSLLDQMESAWGSTFESLNKSEMLWLLSCLTGTMTADRNDNYEPYEVGDRITNASERFHELDFSNQVGLAKAILDQL